MFAFIIQTGVVEIFECMEDHQKLIFSNQNHLAITIVQMKILPCGFAVFMVTRHIGWTQ